MSKYLTKPIAYLQVTDFDDQGNLNIPNLPADMPVVVMVQGNFCGFCSQAKPAFQEFAENNRGKVLVASIQGDGTEAGVPELQKKLNQFYPDFKGYPHYVLYENGKIVPKQIKGRGVEHLKEFAGI